MAGMVAMGSTLASGNGDLLPKPQFHAPRGLGTGPAASQFADSRTSRLAPAARPVITASLANGLAIPAEPAAGVEASAKAARFDAVVRKADLTPQKLAQLFKPAESASSHLRVAKLSVPSPERFAAPAAVVQGGPQMLLAFADPNPGNEAGAALSKLLAAPSEEEVDESASLDMEDEDGEGVLLVPDFADTPDDAPLPGLRPGGRTAAPAIEQPDRASVEKPDAPKRADERRGSERRAAERETPRQKTLASVRPNDPAQRRSDGIGPSLRGLFGGGARAGGGVAVYDISAAKVYMPDGSVLEAHSGIGKMADNPRYVSVKMNGPTPPHTYNLKMRETRFHGVEAIRMLPVDGKNKHGRTGLLTHSYLLRGGRAESHGCVAFKDYNRFLTAFKQGKVKQLVVVPSGGRATVLASVGKRI